MNCSCIFCKKEFPDISKQGLLAHRSHCKPYRESIGKEEYINTSFEKSKGWNKPGHPDYEMMRSILNRTSNEAIIRKYGSRYNHSKLMSDRRTDESYNKQSESRKIGYLNGSITVALGSSRGCHSYFIIGERKIILRSSYEFIFCVFLYIKNIEINYEDIRIRNEQGKVRISDFRVKSHIYEIKGYQSEKDIKIVSDFKKAGYKVKIIYSDTIEKIRNYLIRSNVPIDRYIDKVKEGKDNKCFYKFDADKELGDWRNR